MKKQLLLVKSSVRPGRVADKVEEHVQAELKNYPDFEVSVVDFKETPLPFFDSPQSTSDPAFSPTDTNVKNWTKAVEEADALLILTAEYNHTYTAVLKNAVDWIPGSVWQDKPVAFIGYGWVGGARAITQLRGLLTGFLKADLIETEANLAFTKEIDVDGNVLDAKDTSAAINEVLTALK